MDWSTTLLVAVLVLFYFFWERLRNALVLWTVAFGGADGRREMAFSSRLHVYIARSELLDEVSFVELHQLCREMVDIDQNEGLSMLQDAVLSYKYVSLYRDRVDGSLRGTMLLDEKLKTHRGKDIVVFRLGLALFKQHYSGGALPYIFFLYRVLRSFLCHRGHDVYVLGKVFSYKSYMVAMNSSQQAYPRYDAETPEFEQSLMDEFGKSLETSTAKYDPKTCVVTRSHVRLERHAAPIGEEDLKNPNIKHFVSLNPGWSKGHCLVTCMRMTPGGFATIASNSIMRAIFQRSRHGRAPRTPSPTLDYQASIDDVMKERRLYTTNLGDFSSYIVTTALPEENPDAILGGPSSLL